MPKFSSMRDVLDAVSELHTDIAEFLYGAPPAPAEAVEPATSGIESKIYKCKKCGKPFESAASVAQHVRWKHRVK